MKEDIKTSFTTVRVSSETNKKLKRAVDKYNDRHPGKVISKDDFLSLLLSYCDNFGIDIDDTEKPLTAINKLQKSVKSFNDSAWAAKKEMEKSVRDICEKVDSSINAQKDLCESLAFMIGSSDFNQEVLRPISDELKKVRSAIYVKDEKTGKEFSALEVVFAMIKELKRLKIGV